MSLRVLFLFFCFYPSFLSAQSTEDLFGSWTEIIGRNSLAEKWSVPTTFILQHYEVFNELQFLLLRSGITYHFLSNASASVGYDYIYSESFSGEETVLQHRVWEELSFANKYSSFNISHRYRFESTWTRQEPENALAHRLRYRLKIEHPLYRKWYFTSFNEVFVNLKKPFFNQNRLHLGLGYIFHPNLKVEVGYFKNHFDRRHFDRVRFGLVFRTDLLNN
ncbi:DUF2490 domain-containing protein [Salinimicrobium xinjiangense]|uniref:DUF2490 domain-containing protein n=1 Tax=Salinimicrobium xinjiangense TaxID=438596 RepID=UPI000427109E|nr:DUF2490 domain-containing protein [Salinimicrobium xinjiangense]